MVSRAPVSEVNAANGSGPAPGYRASLASLLDGIVHPLRDVQVTDITQDSRQATPGSAFIACPGRTSHGVQHAPAAVERGAVAVLWEPAPGVEAPSLPAQTVVLAIPDLSQRVGQIADRFFREPSAQLQVAGFTGTNGKTTAAYLLAQAADAVGRRGSYLGTIGFGRPGALATAGLTTPDCVSVHRRLAQSRDAGAKTMSVEVSSHALDQGRVDGVRFDTAVFTNLTRDHLDYHDSEDSYFAAKASLFRQWLEPGRGVAVLNADDARVATLAAELSRHEVWAFSPHLYALNAKPDLIANVGRALAAGLRALGPEP